MPVHALEIALAADIPLHGLYEALLECCIERYAVYEVREQLYDKGARR